MISDISVNQTDSGRNYSRSLLKNTASVVHFGEVTLEIPSMALKEDTILTMERLFRTESLQNSMANVTSGAIAYRFGPDGMHFREKIKITIPFDPSIAESEAALSELFTWFFNSENNKWEKLERVSINLEEFNISSYTDHFTDMINSTLQLPEGPSSINFNPSSIKELKAADPQSGIPQLSGLEPEQSGAATFNIPLRIPPGRGGATPSLVLSYSSEQINSWLGRGFNIDMGSIYIDTRMELPEYDGEDLYMYKGEELILTAEDGKGLRYRPKENRYYEMIYRIRNTSGEDYWEVADKSGNIFTYGSDEGWIGPDRSDRSKTYIWYLTKMCDPNGNTVSYSYEYDSENYYTYLKSIFYSGYSGTDQSYSDKYRIDFIRDTFNSDRREDRRIDGRGKFPSKLADRLQSIEVFYDSLLIRSYDFFYGSNIFGQTILESYSEKDKSGKEFYSYNFDYYELPKNEAGQSLGFGDWEKWDHSFDSMDSSLSGGGGVSLSAGISFMHKAGVHVRGAYNYNTGMNKSLMVDINGDGLLDYIDTENKKLSAYLNTGTGFSSNHIDISGFDSRLNHTAQDSVSFGVSASAGLVSGSTTKQWSWPYAYSAMVDLNGDGFIDQLEKNSSVFRKNVHDENSDSFYFKETSLFIENEGPEESVELTEEDLSEIDRLNKSFYREDPLKRWTPPVSGTVRVIQNAQSTSGEISTDGLYCRTYGQDKLLSFIRIEPGASEGTSSNTFELEKDDKLYFCLDPGSLEMGDDVNWNISIAYTELDFLENMESLSEIDLPPTLDSLPSSQWKNTLYTYVSPIGMDDPYYRRKGDWTNGLTASLYKSIFENAMFIPETVTIDQYLNMKNTIAPLGEDPFKVIDFLSSYDYRVTEGIFLRKKSAPYKIPSYLIKRWSLDEKLSCASFRWFDNEKLYPAQYGKNEIVKAFSKQMSETLFSEVDLLEPGCMDTAGNVFIETISGRDSPIDVIYNGDSLSHFNSVNTRELADSITFETELEGYEYTLTLSEKNYLIDSISQSAYEGRVKDLKMAGFEISLSDYRHLSPIRYGEMIDGLSTSEIEFYGTLYEENSDTGSYSLVSDISREDRLLLLKRLHNISDLSQSCFTENRELFLLTNGDFALINDYILEKGALWDDYFDSYEDSLHSVVYYSPRRDLSVDTEDQLLLLLEDYFFLKEQFPFYHLEDDVYVINSGLNSTERRFVGDFFQSNGIYLWKNLNKRIVFKKGNKLPVEQVQALGGELFEVSVPGFSQAQSNDNVGRVFFPDIDSLGRTVEWELYIPVFDSLKDFNTENLIVYDSLDLDIESLNLVDGDSLPYYIDPLYGGMGNWAYGVWTGYYMWEEEKLVDFYQNLFDEGAAGESDSPPVLTFVQKNFSEIPEEPLVSTIGSTGSVFVSSEALIGDVSSQYKTEIDDMGNSSIINTNFCTYMEKDTFHPSRKGGDSLQSISAASKGTSGSSVPYISQSKSVSTDISGGVNLSVLGISGGTNSGKSWQYSGILDLNGDRYPDLISTSPNGGSTAQVSLGTGTGFKHSQSVALPYRKISSNSNYSLSTGLNGSASEGNQRYTFNGNGSVKDNEISTARSTSVGVTASMGSSIQEIAFMDFNGDGLSDHIKRSGLGSYNVAFNSGNLGQFIPYQWDNSPQVKLWTDNIFSGDKNYSAGLDNSTFSTFGGNVSLSISPYSGSFGFNVNTNQTISKLMDINGDGLPDSVTKRADEEFFLVSFNLGDTFSEAPVKLYRPDWPAADLESSLLNDLETIRNNLSGLASGVTASLPGAESNPFKNFGDPFTISDTINCTKGYSINLGAAYSHEIPLPFYFIISLVPGLNGSYGESSATLSMIDINGDGLADHVRKIPHQDLQVKLNLAGQVGLLKKVEFPSGGSCELTYSREGNTVDMPVSRNVLLSVKMNDGFDESVYDGAHSYRLNFAYEKGYYNRSERMFYGFGRLKTIYADQSEKIVSYNNRDYYGRSLAEKVVNRDKDGFVFNMSTYHYQFKSDPYNPVIKSPLLESEESEMGEKGSSGTIKTEIMYEYNDFGDITRVNDFGISSDSSDNIEFNISYRSLFHSKGYMPSLPSSVTVVNFENRVLRKRNGEYDQYGNLIILRQFYAGTDYAEYLFSYDDFGNHLVTKGPRGQEISYLYDEEVNIFVTSVAEGNKRSGLLVSPYQSQIKWDYALAVELENSDINGNKNRKVYDDFGRLVEIYTAYDTGHMPAVSYQYLCETFPCKAVSHNKLSHDPDDNQSMRTVVFSDGLGRIVQTAKEGEKYSGESSLYGWNISGRVLYDEKSLPVLEGQNGFLAGTDIPGLLELIRPTKKEYDERSRVRIMELSDGCTHSVDYSISENLFVSKVRDPEFNITEKYSDIRGKIRKIIKSDHQTLKLTSATYRYNILGDLLEVRDDLDNAVLFTYDMAGRNLSLHSPDGGYITNVYDKAGNLIEKTDNELRFQGQQIRYDYDGLNRLVNIDYPFMGDSTFQYGDAGLKDNGAGRLISRNDESGSTDNKYGKLGEIIRVDRTLNRLRPLSAGKTATFQYKVDYLGRMEQIIYPDGETVAYAYGHGGQVTSVKGERSGYETTYIERITYDEYGRRTGIKYGNNTETTYEYDPHRRWLEKLHTQGKFNRTIQDISYEFDNVGNILSLENDSDQYKTTQLYEYDDLYQLTSGHGVFESKTYGYLEYTSTYGQSFTYDTIGNMIEKKSSQYYSPSRSEVGNLNYSSEYNYYTDKPHRAETIGNLWYLYDENGNVIEEREGGHSVTAAGSGSSSIFSDGDIRWTDYGFGLDRSTGEDENIVYNRINTWDEENRLKQSSDVNYTVNYLYDSAGERTVKNSPLGETLYFNSLWQVSMETGGNRQSKHIYVGESRIATRLNTEGDDSYGYDLQNTYYYHGDHLGSANIVTDYTGGIFEHIEYTPFGELWVENSNDSFDMIPFRFTGKEWDEETKLYYMSARYQNPMTSRWMSVDPAGPGLVNPNRDGFNIIESLNWYSYCSNNPVRYVDPTGLQSDVGNGLLYNDKNGAFSFNDGRDVKAEARVEVERGSDKYADENDTARVLIGGNTISEYGGVQSEKNYRSGTQLSPERNEDDLSDETYPNATLPLGDDYILTLTSGSESYKNAMEVTSDTAQIPGFPLKGILKSWGFLMHSFSSKTIDREKAWSWGCQMIPDNSFDSLRGDLEGIGFANGDSVPLSITQKENLFGPGY